MPSNLQELSRARIRQTDVKVAQTLPYQDWTNMQDGETLTMTTHTLPGVEVTMPQEDWHKIMTILEAHYHARSTNPAVNDAWLKYRMLVAISQK